MNTGQSVPEAAETIVQRVYWREQEEQEVEPLYLHVVVVAWGVVQSDQDQLRWDREYTAQS